MRSRSRCRSARHKKNREESTRLTGKDIDHLHLCPGHGLPLDGCEQCADLQADRARGTGLVSNADPAAEGVGLWNPAFGCNVYVPERRIIEDEKIWIETPNCWRQGKRRRVADRL